MVESVCTCLCFHRCQTDARLLSNFFWNQLEFLAWLEFKHLLLAISEKRRKKSKIIQTMESGHQNFLCRLFSSRNWVVFKLWPPKWIPKLSKSSRDNILMEKILSNKHPCSPFLRPCWNTKFRYGCKVLTPPWTPAGSKRRPVELISLHSNLHHIKIHFWLETKQNLNH